MGFSCMAWWSGKRLATRSGQRGRAHSSWPVRAGTTWADEHRAGDLLALAAGVVGAVLLAVPHDEVDLRAGGVLLDASVEDQTPDAGARGDHARTQLTAKHET